MVSLNIIYMTLRTMIMYISINLNYFSLKTLEINFMIFIRHLELHLKILLLILIQVFI